MQRLRLFGEMFVGWVRSRGDVGLLERVEELFGSLDVLGGVVDGGLQVEDAGLGLLDGRVFHIKFIIVGI